jgi:hypothetical protein
MSKIIQRLDKYSKEVYLDLICALEYPDQEPEHKEAKWYHLFYLLIPIVGFFIFQEMIRDKGRRNANGRADQVLD